MPDTLDSLDSKESVDTQVFPVLLEILEMTVCPEPLDGLDRLEPPERTDSLVCPDRRESLPVSHCALDLLDTLD